ncbi:c-type cytochrome biogenesis protein CcmI [Pseudoponticoccus marisrubri]|uniref:Cytochrome C n=1 Tax=Pseudoponticoccus marisrubri TaxID=1685382 RepID=A0A0W7WEX7_9RHOB|nr:c-type cytochrome biogenesis protein CcmI [Pseudoponticoccus marisrubri]KUF09031.1 cytochrome C [Pseudoponticoccus marisrubri]
MMFWIVTGAVALVSAGALVVALLRGRRATGPAEAFDLKIYRDQLSEIEADASRGKIAPDEAERLKTEISRRILAADARVRAGGDGSGQPRLAGPVAALVVALILVGGGFGLYLQIGAPGFPDVPRSARIAAAQNMLVDRPAQEVVEGRVPASAPVEVSERYAELIAKLREAVAERPDDLRGHILLAQSEANMANFKAAHAAQARVIEIKGDDATAQDYADLGDFMVLAAGGYVSPEAQAAFETALEMDPQNGVARFYGGLLMAQTGRPDIGFRIWDRLLRESRPEAPWVPQIRSQIEELAFRAGERDYQLPEAPAPRGPSAADIAAAEDMSPEDRQQMIRGMVGQLSDRLATEGGPPEDWARLISSLGVLGDTEQASAIWTEAQSVFAESEAALEVLARAARQAGLTE